jgi:hypothetical protein
VASSEQASTDRPTRYRCNSCGNLTRFDVTTLRRTRAFHHYSVGGDLEIEDVDVLSEVIEDVRCRWCGTGSSVVELPEGAAASERADLSDAG